MSDCVGSQRFDWGAVLLRRQKVQAHRVSNGRSIRFIGVLKECGYLTM
jgi:hypothetical protein